jgi:hypothetical protein
MAHKNFTKLVTAQRFVKQQKKKGNQVAGILDRKVGKKTVWEVAYYPK